MRIPMKTKRNLMMKTMMHQFPMRLLMKILIMKVLTLGNEEIEKMLTQEMLLVVNVGV
jgi:hypothetical protein